MMKLSHEKMVHLSHIVADRLAADGTLEFRSTTNEIRNRVLMALKEEMRRDEAIEDRVRRKITSQKRTIPEGSPEWDVLFRRYYEEENTALGGF